MLQHVLKLYTWYTGSGAFQKMQAKVSHQWSLAWASHHEPQRNLQLDVSCAGLGGA